jgi:superfamily II DNA or RNA helicase
MIHITVGTDLLIEGLTIKQLSFIQEFLTLSNPMHGKMLAMKKSVWSVPKQFVYYKNEEDGIQIPRGMLGRVTRWLDKQGAEYVIDQSHIEAHKKYRELEWGSITSKITLREYQEPIVKEILKHKEGTIVMGTGTGKTVVAVHLIAKLRKKATILVPNNVLLVQWKNAIKQFLDFEAGIVNGETKDIKAITVATFQSLASNPDLLSELARQTGVLIVDECQGAVTENRAKIITSFYPDYLFGLTATPQRSESDGRTNSIFFYFGEEIVSYHETSCVPEVQIIRTGVDIAADEYHRMVEEMVDHPGRNILIKGLIIGEVLSGRKVLVLTKRIAHYQHFEEEFGNRENFLFISSDNPNRNEILADLKNGDKDFACIIGTTSLLSVGTDVPRLDTLIIACDMREDVLTTQSIGRILRLFEGKPSPRVIDLWDERVPIFKRQGVVRRKLYKKKGWKIV